MSYRNEVGRSGFLVSEYGCWNHLRVFSLRALRQLLDHHEFRLLEINSTTIGEVDTGVGDFHLLALRAAHYHAVGPLDAVASVLASLI